MSTRLVLLLTLAPLIGCHDLSRFPLPLADRGWVGEVGPTSDLPSSETGTLDRSSFEAGSSDRSVADRKRDQPGPDLRVDHAFSYAWKVGAWSACSKACDGGSSSRSVWCERSDGLKVADGLCTGVKPATTQACNTQPCCSTNALAGSSQCGGTAKIQWFPFASNTGDAADQAACAQSCTAWAKGQLASWCCQLYEDSSPGTLWVCRVYDTPTVSPVAKASFAGVGTCKSP